MLIFTFQHSLFVHLQYLFPDFELNKRDKDWRIKIKKKKNKK